MICISINQESRRFALVDMLNAGPLCDLLEIRLDRFGKAPDLSELLKNKTRPVIMSCRRTSDGGLYEGTEEERLALLRQCIISKADYVEIEHDVADQIRRFPPTQRIISYTNLRETPEDIVDIYNDMLTKSPDVIKLTTLARTPEEAWPLVQILAKQRMPTVVVGLGRPGLMLTLLGKKIGAPFTFAALERGMEAYPGQPTISDLKDIYRYDEITRSTRLVAVTGFSDRQYLSVALLNAALAHCEMPFRCLPMGVGSLPLFRKVLGAAKLAAVVVQPEYQTAMLEIGVELHGAARRCEAVDLLIHKDEVWHGFYSSATGWIEALGAVMPAGPEPFKDRIVLIAGLHGPARTLAQEVMRKGGGVILASRKRKEGQLLAQQLGCRFTAFEGIYSIMHHALVVADDEKDAPGSLQPIRGTYLKEGMAVMDLTANLQLTPLLQEAQARGCNLVEPERLLLDHIQKLAQHLTGQEVPQTVLAQAIPDVLQE